MQKKYGIVCIFLVVGFCFVFQRTKLTNNATATTDATPSVTEIKPNEDVSLANELKRRRLYKSILEAFYSFHELSKKKASDVGSENVDLLQLLSLWAESANFIDFKWHKQELEKITFGIQSKLYNLQHPADCFKARIIVCDDKSGGLTSRLRQYAYCLLLAAVTNRTFIMLSNGAIFNYSLHGWASIFQPITNCSFTEHIDVKEMLDVSSAEHQDARVIRVRLINFMHSHPVQRPLTVPSQLSSKLFQHHSNPPAFFAAQFTRYFWNFSERTQSILAEAEAKVPFAQGPIVGVQIKRSNTTKETIRYPVEEYIKWAEYWFRVEEIRLEKPLKRRIYLATDGMTVFSEIKQLFPHYEIYGNETFANDAQLETRYNEKSLFGIITDVHLLSKCHFVVCTASSNVGRTVYDLMQVFQGDMDYNFISLDVSYQFDPFQQDHELVAIHSYNSTLPEHISLESNDTITIISNAHNGLSKGTNKRTNQTGLFPTFMAKEKWKIVDFPLFQHV